MSRPILFVYDAQRIIDEAREDLRSTGRRVTSINWVIGIALALVLGSFIGGYMSARVPYDAPAAMEAVR